MEERERGGQQSVEVRRVWLGFVRGSTGSAHSECMRQLITLARLIARPCVRSLMRPLAHPSIMPADIFNELIETGKLPVRPGVKRLISE